MDASRSRPWVGAALAVLVLLFVVDLATAPRRRRHHALRDRAAARLARRDLAHHRRRRRAGAAGRGGLAPAHERHGARQRDPVHLRRGGARRARDRRRAHPHPPRAGGGARERARRGERGAGRHRRPRRAAARRRGRGRLHDHARARSPRRARPCSRAGSGWATLALGSRPTPSWPPSSPQRCAAAIDSARLLAEADEAYGMLDAVFARAPGRARALRPRAAATSGSTTTSPRSTACPPPSRSGGRSTEIVPDVEGIVHGHARRCSRPAASSSNVERRRLDPRGARRAARVRGLLLARAPPRRRRGARRRLRRLRGHRAARGRARAARADRALRVAAARALRGRRGHGRARGRPPRLREPGLPGHVAATRPRSCRRCRRCSTSSRRTSARTPAGARSCGSRASATPATS